MSPLVLIDTSAWAQALRRSGDPSVRARVAKHLADLTAAWCDMVRLELWAGVRNDADARACEAWRQRTRASRSTRPCGTLPLISLHGLVRLGSRCRPQTY